MKRFLNFPDGLRKSGGSVAVTYKDFKINIDSLSGSAYTTTGAGTVLLPVKSGMNMVMAIEFDGFSSDDDMKNIANVINDALVANPGGSIVDIKGYRLSNFEMTNP